MSVCECGHRHGAHIGDDWGECIECERPDRCRFYNEERSIVLSPADHKMIVDALVNAWAHVHTNPE